MATFDVSRNAVDSLHLSSMFCLQDLISTMTEEIQNHATLCVSMSQKSTCIYDSGLPAPHSLAVESCGHVQCVSVTWNVGPCLSRAA